MSAVTVGNELVHYEVFGRGPALVLIHGWLGSWRYWIPTMQQLSSDYRVYALDLWGYGDSSKQPNLYHIDQQVELVNDFMDTLGMVKAAMVGHGLGAGVAIRFAMQWPDKVARLMTVSLPTSGDGTLSDRVTSSSPKAWLEKLIDRSRPDFQAIETEAAKADPGAVQQGAADMSVVDWGSELSTVQAPSIIVYGERDPLVRVPADGWFDSLREGTHRVLLNDSQHFPMLDETAVFNRLLVDFLDAEDPRSIQTKQYWERRFR